MGTLVLPETEAMDVVSINRCGMRCQPVIGGRAVKVSGR